jgi:hypothetical protein
MQMEQEEEDGEEGNHLCTTFWTSDHSCIWPSTNQNMWKPEGARTGLYDRCGKVSVFYSWMHFIVALAS